MEEVRCYGCMKIKQGDGVCPFCGFDNRQANEPHQLPAGTMLKGQYLTGRVLGQGGFGITYMGWDRLLEIPVAIKEYFPNGFVVRNCGESLSVRSLDGKTDGVFENNKKRFQREGKMLARFSDVPEIVQVKTFFMENNTAYIVMEYLEGTTLRENIAGKGGRISRKETYEILQPIMKALSQVHRAGLVHRDISPDNIMLLPDGRVKLLDFGVAREIGMDSASAPLTKSTEAIFKQGFCPIEQYQRHGKLGPWTDVYALCATIYFCLTGETPPDAPERALGGEWIPFSKRGVQIPKNEEMVIREGMALRVEERIPNLPTLYRKLFQDEQKSDARAGEDDNENNLETSEIEENRMNDSGKAVPDKDTCRECAVHQDTGEKNSNKNDDANVYAIKIGKNGYRKRLLFIIIIIIIIIVAAFAIIIGMSQNRGYNKSENAGTTGNIETTDGETTGDIETTDGEITGDIETTVYSGQCGDYVYWELAMATGTLTISGIGDMWNYDSVDGSWSQGMEGIDRPGEVPGWNTYNSYIKKIVFEEGVTSVGMGFTADEYSALTELDLGNVETIGLCAFQGTLLTEIIVPESVTELDGWAFGYNNYLEKIEFLGSPASVQSNVLAGCPKLESIVFHGDPVWIGFDDDASRSIIGSTEDGDSYPENAVLYGPADGYVKTYCMQYGLPFLELEE